CRHQSMAWLQGAESDGEIVVSDRRKQHTIVGGNTARYVASHRHQCFVDEKQKSFRYRCFKTSPYTRTEKTTDHKRGFRPGFERLDRTIPLRLCPFRRVG